MSDRLEQELELRIQKSILLLEDELVIAIEKTFSSPENKPKPYANLQPSQYRNLLVYAEATDSIETIKNFLQYQVGRDDKWGRGKDSLAERIINDIYGVLKQKAIYVVEDEYTLDIIVEIANQKSASSAKNGDNFNLYKIEEIVKQTNASYTDRKRQEVWIELTRRYLGYGYRHLVYLLKSDEMKKKVVSQK